MADANGATCSRVLRVNRIIPRIFSFDPSFFEEFALLYHRSYTHERSSFAYFSSALRCFSHLCSNTKREGVP
jgi:hypothetical protein